MKKIFTVFMALAFLGVFSACTGSEEKKAFSSGQSGCQGASQGKTDSPGGASDGAGKDKKSLVVYFSWSGNTERVAESIQSQTGADIFEIIPAEPYSDDYDTVVEVAREEQRKNARPVISGSIENIEQYDVIYVGFPNWWGDMPMILYTFFDSYDLSGKTVALFCTSGGSGLSGTVNEVKNLEPGAEVTSGLHIGSGSASNPDNAVSEWLKDTGLAEQ